MSSSLLLPTQLYIIATPLGNPLDLSLRAIQHLNNIQLLFCEDTRKTSKLLESIPHFQKSRIHLMALPGDSERNIDWKEKARHWVSKGAETWGLVSDAGTPIVNDPGLSLIHFCREHDIKVEAVPGPCAPILAWQWTGGFGLPYYFGGFVPKSQSIKELNSFFGALRFTKTFCFFDTRYQIQNTLEYLVEHENHRKIFLLREMTKTYEELMEGSPHQVLSQVRDKLKKENALGELTLLIEGDGQEGAKSQGEDLKVDELLSFRKDPPKIAAKWAAKILNISSREIYQKMISLAEKEAKK